MITTNIPARMSGEPDDPGVSAWWLQRGIDEPRSIACDRFYTVRENMRAIAVTLEAFRTIERAGASQVLEVAMRSFDGGRLLPANTPPAPATPWWVDELGVALVEGQLRYLGTSGLVLRGRDAVEGAYWGLVPERHPDKGGSHEGFVKLGQAREQAMKWLEGGRG